MSAPERIWAWQRPRNSCGSWAADEGREPLTFADDTIGSTLYVRADLHDEAERALSEAQAALAAERDRVAGLREAARIACEEWWRVPWTLGPQPSMLDHMAALAAKVVEADNAALAQPPREEG